MGVRPSAFSANAYDDYAYSFERSDHIWDFFQHREPAEDFRVSQADLARREDRGFRVDSPGDFRGISGGHTGRCTGRRSSADDSSTAIHTANVGHHICHRSRRDQRLPVPQHVHLVEQRRAILVFPGIPRA